MTNRSHRALINSKWLESVDEATVESPDRLGDGPTSSCRFLLRSHRHGNANRVRHFTQVETGSGVTLDFADAAGDVSGGHLAFLVTERQFDEIFDRIVDMKIP